MSPDTPDKAARVRELFERAGCRLLFLATTAGI